MFSFFVKKKNSPDTTPPEEAIPGPESHPEGNDFIFIERRNQPSPVPNSQQPAMYPPMPELPGYPPIRGAPVRVNSLPVNYLEDVPFKLAPELCQEDSLDITQLMVDGILAVMTKQLQFDEYEFQLEREIVSQ